MHQTPRTALVVAAIAAVLLGGGCTVPVPGLPAPSGAAPAAGTAVPIETDPVAWMDKICTALLPTLKTRATQPKLDAANPRDSITALSAYLGEAGPVIDGTLNGMSAAGPSPIAGGDDAVAALRTTLSAYRDAAREAKTTLDGIDTTNRSTLTAQFPQAVAQLTALSNVPNPAADLGNNPELDAAAAKAPQCRQASAVIN
jgi:hypothetical protein